MTFVREEVSSFQNFVESRLQVVVGLLEGLRRDRQVGGQGLWYSTFNLRMFINIDSLMYHFAINERERVKISPKSFMNFESSKG